LVLAIRVGYSKDTAAQIGYENLRKPEIADALGKALAERSQRTQITQDYVLDTVGTSQVPLASWVNSPLGYQCQRTGKSWPAAADDIGTPTICNARAS
jgi:hypothetical protein